MPKVDRNRKPQGPAYGESYAGLPASSESHNYPEGVPPEPMELAKKENAESVEALVYSVDAAQQENRQKLQSLKNGAQHSAAQIGYEIALTVLSYDTMVNRAAVHYINEYQRLEDSGRLGFKTLNDGDFKQYVEDLTNFCFDPFTRPPSFHSAPEPAASLPEASSEEPASEV
jgi:hypothetical protein